LIIISRIIDL
jgi:Ras-related protein Rab-1A